MATWIRERGDMKFRAVAVGLVKDGHPVQCFSNNEQTVLKWGDQISRKERVPVEVFIIEERSIRTFDPPPLEEPKRG
jgi:hypothetical protein